MNAIFSKVLHEKVALPLHIFFIENLFGFQLIDFNFFILSNFIYYNFCTATLLFYENEILDKGRIWNTTKIGL